MTASNSTSGEVISSDKVGGAAVYNSAGEKLGSIDDLMIDKRSGQIRYAVLEFGGFLGIGTDRYPMPWNVLNYDKSKGGYTVPLDRTRLKDAPRYDAKAVPTYDRAYGATVDRYYGIFGP
jgi:sporulation protein YlmC with PRC-barrel domain